MAMQKFATQITGRAAVDEIESWIEAQLRPVS